MAQTNFPTQDKATSLYGSGVSIGDTSVKLVAFTDIYGNVLTMADIGLKGFGTSEPGTDNEEAITFSGITNNGDGSQTLTGVKHVLAKAPFTETTGFLRGHSGGTRFVISNTAAFYNDLITYVNGVVVGGAQDASTTVKGIAKLTTVPTLANDPIAVGATDVATTGASKVIRSKANSTIDDSLLNLTTAGDIVYSDGTDLQRLSIGTSGQVLTSNGTVPTWQTDVEVAATDVQTFTANGTWTKPAGAVSVKMIVVGGGGGGGSGVRINSTSGSPGAGGAGAGVTVNELPASLLPASVSVVIGPGGNGGAAAVGTGNAGNGGGASSFGTFSANGGSGGAGGVSGSVDSTGGAGGTGIYTGGSGGNGPSSSSFDGFPGGSSMLAGAGGGGGGGGYGQSKAGGYGGITGSFSSGGGASGGAVNGGAGANGVDSYFTGSGGGGGGGANNTNVNGGAGGTGAKGCGGGGGGAVYNGTGALSGAGGAGGSGKVVVITFF